MPDSTETMREEAESSDSGSDLDGGLEPWGGCWWRRMEGWALCNTGPSISSTLVHFRGMVTPPQRRQGIFLPLTAFGLLLAVVC